MREPKVYIKILINFIIVIYAIVFLLIALPYFLRFFMPFVIGWIVAMVANPLVRFLEKKVKILRKHSSAIIILVVVAAIVATTYLLIAILVKEIAELMNDLPTIVNQVGSQFNKFSEQISHLSEALPSKIRVMLDNIIIGVGDNVTSIVDKIEPPTMSSAGTFAKNVAEGFLMVIVTILSAYFFTVERDDLVAGLKKNLPNSITNGWHLVYDNFKSAFGGYFKAQFKIMLVVTVIMFIGFEILGVGYSFLLALGIAFLDFLPVFGTGAVLWPWAVIDMISGNYMRAVGLVAIYLICQIVKQVLQPKMVGDSIGISPLATLIFMFTGYQLYGVIGIIFGIPIGMVFVNMYRIGMFDRLISGFRIIIHDMNEFRKF